MNVNYDTCGVLSQVVKYVLIIILISLPSDGAQVTGELLGTKSDQTVKTLTSDSYWDS